MPCHLRQKPLMRNVPSYVLYSPNLIILLYWPHNINSTIDMFIQNIATTPIILLTLDSSMNYFIARDLTI